MLGSNEPFPYFPPSFPQKSALGGMCDNLNHRSKRRRISKTTKQFLELEAQVDDEESSEEEINPNHEHFIVKDEPEDRDNQHQDHARLLHLLQLRADDDTQVAPPQAIKQERDLAVITDTTERVMELIGGPGGLSAGIWEMRCRYGQEQVMVDRVNAVLPDLPPHTCVLAVNWTPLLGGRIFIEVSDGPDARSRHDSFICALNTLVRPSFFRERFYPFQGMANWMKNWVEIRTANTFARVRQPASYRGDLGYIFSRSKADTTLWLALVPRISLTTNIKRSRPPRSTVTPRKIQLSRLVNKTVDIHETEGYFDFQGHQFTLEGYLLIAVKDVEFFPEINPCPTLDELGRFDALAQMPSQIRDDYLLGSLQKRMSAHDRVWIRRGKNHGQVAIIQETRGSEADVYLLDEDTIETVLIEDLRGNFEVGDHVAIQHGTDKGTTGYIVRCKDGLVTVVNPTTQIEVEAPSDYVFFWNFPIHVSQHEGPKFEVGDEVIVRSGPESGLQGVVEAVRDANIDIREGEFFPPEFEVPINSLSRLHSRSSSDRALRIGDEVQVAGGLHHGRAGSIIGITAMQAALIKEGPSQPKVHTLHSCHVEHTSTPKRNDLLLAMQEGNFDPHRGLMGKACSVAIGQLKGYRGWVVDTHPNGIITVRHEARLQQSVQYPIDQLAFHDEYQFLEPPRVSSPVPVRSPTPPYPDIPNPPLRASRRALRPAWDPTAPPPRLSTPPPEPSDVLPPTWIVEPEFHRYRILLRDNFGAGHAGVFRGMQGDCVLLMDRQCKFGTLNPHPLVMVRHVTPKQINDLVVPIEGEYKARVMKVRNISLVECTLAEVGVRSRSKKIIRPVIKTVALARILPP